jgi:hypothetical protein
MDRKDELTPAHALRVALSVVFLLPSLAPAQDQPRPALDVTIGQVRRMTMVRVPVTVRNTSNEAVFVPVCGESEGGFKILCTLGVRIEVRSHEHWIAAKEKSCNCALLGGEPLKTGVTLDAGETLNLVYFLPTEFFRFKSGQSLRLRISVWPNAATVNEERTRMELATSAFQFP